MADTRRSHEASAQRLALVEHCQQPHHLRTTYTWLAMLHASQGSWRDVEQDRHMGLGMPMFYPGLLGLVQATIGKREEALVSMTSLETHLGRLLEGIWPTAPLLICLALIALALRDQQRALLLSPRLLAFRGQHYWFLVDRILGLLAIERGDWEVARTHLIAAQQLLNVKDCDLNWREPWWHKSTSKQDEEGTEAPPAPGNASSRHLLSARNWE